jgi:hypothetical protein
VTGARRLPGVECAQVESRKVVDYLLALTHPDGGRRRASFSPVALVQTLGKPLRGFSWSMRASTRLPAFVTTRRGGRAYFRSIVT